MADRRRSRPFVSFPFPSHVPVSFVPVRHLSCTVRSCPPPPSRFAVVSTCRVLSPSCTRGIVATRGPLVPFTGSFPYCSLPVDPSRHHGGHSAHVSRISNPAIWTRAKSHLKTYCCSCWMQRQHRAARSYQRAGRFTFVVVRENGALRFLRLAPVQQRGKWCRLSRLFVRPPAAGFFRRVRSPVTWSAFSQRNANATTFQIHELPF